MLRDLVESPANDEKNQRDLIFCVRRSRILAERILLFVAERSTYLIERSSSTIIT